MVVSAALDSKLETKNLTHEDVMIILGDIEYKDWGLHYTRVDETTGLMQFFWFDLEELQESRRWVIDLTQPHSDIVRTCLAAAVMAEEHEVREKFRYKGKRVFNPHYNVDRLAEIASKLENLELPNKGSVSQSVEETDSKPVQ